MGSAGQTKGKGQELSEKLWGGRFEQETDPLIDSFSQSLSFDQRLFKEDITGSRAWARALLQAGVLTAAEAKQIDQGLAEIAVELEAGTPLPAGSEDIHMAIESRLTEKIGPAGAKLHTGRSRNDQVATDLRLYVKDAGQQLGAAIDRLQKTLVDRAQEVIDVAMPGYTHTQRAQPVLLSHHLLAYIEMLRRDHARLDDALDRADVSPLGSGALAGAGFAIDRESLARDLGFKEASANSLDAVADRDFVLELLATLSILMIHLSRLNAEIVLWTSAEFNFAELPDALASGSSMLPNKKNPCAAELVRAKSARVSGHLVAMLMVMKGLPLAYNRDLQEDKEPVFDSVDTGLACVQVTARLVEGLKFKPEILEAAAIGGYTLATEAADYLVRKGLPFREAHRVVGQAVAHAIAQNKPLERLSLEELRRFSPAFDNDLWQSLSLKGALNSRNVVGGTAPGRVREALANAKA